MTIASVGYLIKLKLTKRVSVYYSMGSENMRTNNDLYGNRKSRAG
jgi:hypothetical protein